MTMREWYEAIGGMTGQISNRKQKKLLFPNWSIRK